LLKIRWAEGFRCTQYGQEKAWSTKKGFSTVLTAVSKPLGQPQYLPLVWQAVLSIGAESID